MLKTRNADGVPRIQFNGVLNDEGDNDMAPCKRDPSPIQSTAFEYPAERAATGGGGHVRVDSQRASPAVMIALAQPALSNTQPSLAKRSSNLSVELVVVGGHRRPAQLGAVCSEASPCSDIIRWV